MKEILNSYQNAIESLDKAIESLERVSSLQKEKSFSEHKMRIRKIQFVKMQLNAILTKQ